LREPDRATNSIQELVTGWNILRGSRNLKGKQELEIREFEEKGQ